MGCGPLTNKKERGPAFSILKQNLIRFDTVLGAGEYSHQPGEEKECGELKSSWE